MIFYSLPEALLMVLLAIMLDWWIGDPRRIPHPVIYIGKWISLLERWLRKPGKPGSMDGSTPGRGRMERLNGVVLTLTVTVTSFAGIWGICMMLYWIHPWLG